MKTLGTYRKLGMRYVILMVLGMALLMLQSRNPPRLLLPVCKTASCSCNFASLLVLVGHLVHKLARINSPFVVPDYAEIFVVKSGCRKGRPSAVDHRLFLFKSAGLKCRGGRKSLVPKRNPEIRQTALFQSRQDSSMLAFLAFTSCLERTN